MEGKIKEALTTLLKDSDCFVDEVLIEKEGKQTFLRIIIDKEGYITVDDCVKITNLISPFLDEKDFIKENYILDVCSKEKGYEEDAKKN